MFLITAQIAYGGYILPARLHCGLGLKYLYYDINVLRDTADGGTLDAGLAYQFYVSPKEATTIDVGIAVQNIIRIAPAKIYVDEDEIAKILFIFKCGIGFKSFVFPRYSKKNK